MNEKFEFHARNSDLPFIFLDLFLKKGSYGDAELVLLFEKEIVSLYWSEKGINQASEIGKQILDNVFFLNLIKKMDQVEEGIEKFPFNPKEDNVLEKWNVFEEIVFGYSAVYRFCEEPFLRSMEKKILSRFGSELVNEILHEPKKINRLELKGEEKKIFKVLKIVGEKKLSLHLKNEKLFADLEKFMGYLSKKIGSSIEDVYYLRSNEIKNILVNGTVDHILIDERKKGCAFSNGPGLDYLCVTGKEFKRLKDLVKPKTKEIKGFVANKGKVTGKVRVNLSWVKSIDFERGDIIVTGMSNPNMFPYLKKAAAIVTDEGGLTCHAATIARELNIPCIIGTKVATQLLKDGDLVEVNANTGIVKKINEDENQSKMNLPTNEQALEYFNEYKVPRNIKDHCLAVQKLAFFLAKKLKEAGVEINIDLVDRAALLHDLFKPITFKDLINDPYEKLTDEQVEFWTQMKNKFPGKYENQVAFEIFKEKFPKLAITLRNESDPYLRKRTTEESVVHHADYRIFQDKIVSLDRRFDYFKKTYPGTKNFWDDYLKHCKEEEKSLFKHLDFPSEKLAEEIEKTIKK